MSSPQAEGLNVIALVSGGKDSFFSLLHCRANGHRIVALANLHPALSKKLGPSDGTSAPPAATISAAPAASAAVSAPDLEVLTLGSGPSQDPGQGVSPAALLPDHGGGAAGNELVPDVDEDEQDLNSFMYQTVGHEVIPLYAEATGIPLYRRAITGGATQHGKDYFRGRHSTASGAAEGPGSSGHRGGRHPGVAAESAGEAPDTLSRGHGQETRGSDRSAPDASAGRDAHEVHVADLPGDPDETESMVPLLQAIKRAHPEANAICAGAILSTYQRTRVESVAIRLGLTPLAYLWKFPVLPTPGSSVSGPPAAGSDAQLLDDMAAVGMEARIIKVASGGLDDSFLWTNVASATGKSRLARAMRRFGAAEPGAVIGEGGEFETLVLDGPSSLFKKRVVVDEENRRVVREGGGSAWLSLRNARLEDKGEVNGEGSEGIVRRPDLLGPKFADVLHALRFPGAVDSQSDLQSGLEIESPRLGTLQASQSKRLQQWSFVGTEPGSIEEETRFIVEQIRQRLRQRSLPSSAIVSATIILRRMADFPAVNDIYGTLFDAPNPPSRVTISCGDALCAAAANADIAVYLTLHTALQAGQRQGLHVQSRSYWAPANIGPYSQAICIPVASLAASSSHNNNDASSSGTRLVSIAGQIPLVPSSMALPHGNSATILPLQLALSLQHLWRIGAETGVQWWTSAVAYFPACSPSSSQKESGHDDGMALKVRLASQAWRAAHLSAKSSAGEDGDNDEEEEDENGPDLWDRRFNPEYMTFSGGDEKTVVPALPDRSVLARTDNDIHKVVTPPLFVAEVEELPRGAGVEWHAHLGVGYAGEGSVQLREMDLPLPGGDDDDKTAREAAVWQVIVGSGEGSGASFVQTVLAEEFDGRSQLGQHGQAAKAALERLGTVGPVGEPVAVVRYVDVEILEKDKKRAGPERNGCGPVVPCRSLWGGSGKRLAAVTVYQSVFE